RILSVAGQFLKLSQQVLSLALNILIRSAIGSAASAVTSLSALPCCGFLTFGQIRELLGKFIDFLLLLLILLTLSLAALNCFILVLALVQFEGEQVCQVLSASRLLSATAATASTLLNLNLGVEGCGLSEKLGCRTFIFPGFIRLLFHK